MFVLKVSFFLCIITTAVVLLIFFLLPSGCVLINFSSTRRMWRIVVLLCAPVVVVVVSLLVDSTFVWQFTKAKRNFWKPWERWDRCTGGGLLAFAVYFIYFYLLLRNKHEKLSNSAAVFLKFQFLWNKQTCKVENHRNRNVLKIS